MPGAPEHEQIMRCRVTRNSFNHVELECRSLPRLPALSDRQCAGDYQRSCLCRNARLADRPFEACTDRVVVVHGRARATAAGALQEQAADLPVVDSATVGLPGPAECEVTSNLPAVECADDGFADAPGSGNRRGICLLGRSRPSSCPIGASGKTRATCRRWDARSRICLAGRIGWCGRFPVQAERARFREWAGGRLGAVRVVRFRATSIRAKVELARRAAAPDSVAVGAGRVVSLGRRAVLRTGIRGNAAHRDSWAQVGGFRDWLIDGYASDQGDPPPNWAVGRVIGMLEARARFSDGFPRFMSASAGAAISMATPATVDGGGEGTYFVDLGDRTGRAVAIRQGEWSVADRPGVYFRRPEGLLACRSRLAAGRSNFRQYVNLSEPDFRLMIAWLTTALRPVGPYPVLVLNGEQASGKSTLAANLCACWSTRRRRPSWPCPAARTT